MTDTLSILSGKCMAVAVVINPHKISGDTVESYMADVPENVDIIGMVQRDRIVNVDVYTPGRKSIYHHSLDDALNLALQFLDHE